MSIFKSKPQKEWTLECQVGDYIIGNEIIEISSRSTPTGSRLCNVVSTVQFGVKGTIQEKHLNNVKVHDEWFRFVSGHDVDRNDVGSLLVVTIIPKDSFGKTDGNL